MIFFNCEREDIHSIAETICLEGFEKSREQYSFIPKPNKRNNAIKAGKILLESEDDTSNHVFSHLMSSRTFYGNKPKSLGLGVIVHNCVDDKYFLCLQPVCDSVRLEEDTVFLFVELSKSDDDRWKRSSHIIVKGSGATVQLFCEAKSDKCYVAAFSPDRRYQRVLEKKSNEGIPEFVDKCKKKYVWVDQLKPSHAQRAVENLARDLSRVGLTESVWLRLLGKR